MSELLQKCSNDKIRWKIHKSPICGNFHTLLRTYEMIAPIPFKVLEQTLNSTIVTLNCPTGSSETYNRKNSEIFRLFHFNATKKYRFDRTRKLIVFKRGPTGFTFDFFF
ncbi:hypothetical protein FFZ95_00610 [Leptospira borgpetersenii]|nr:hypothetical protein FFZ95_00610 [Leptospira borgpetersenii]TQE58018.1 hypothetical protein FFZ96_05160 [Leptospira borgpetersenii]